MKPSAEGDTVRLIDDASWVESVQIAEDRLAHQIGVERRNAIDLVGPDERQVAHAHIPALFLIDHRNRLDELDIGRPPDQGLQVQPVDPIDDLGCGLCSSTSWL
jgi:hypothetical protein